MDEGVLEGLGQGWGQPVGEDGYGASYTRFDVTEGVRDGSLRACYTIHSLERNPLSYRRSHLTSSGSPARYLHFTLG